MSKYSTKANDSFTTKWKLFCFASAIGQIKNANLETFQNFIIDDELIKIYTAEYHQYEYNVKLTSVNLTPNQIYTKLKQYDINPLKTAFEEDYISSFENKFPKSKFNKLVNETASCYYCGTTKEQFDKLYHAHKIFKKTARGFNFEIDRKEPNKEYTESNCVMTCYWCNNAKTDEFNAEEFKPFGAVIGKILKNRISI